jgi:signal recognition particle GTPase
MKGSIRFFIGLSLSAIIACYGCGVEKSEAEMQAAQQAMNEAKSYHAEKLAASDWDEAMKAWDRGQAAVEAGKPAKTYFLQAKSRFAKTATIAKSHYDQLSQEISDMQRTISERFEKVKSALIGGRLAPRVQNQIKPILVDVEAGNESIDKLIEQGEFLTARETAREIQKKVFNAELIMAGKKPAS